jgi:hypothetical protein
LARIIEAWQAAGYWDKLDTANVWFQPIDAIKCILRSQITTYRVNVQNTQRRARLIPLLVVRALLYITSSQSQAATSIETMDRCCPSASKHLLNNSVTTKTHPLAIVSESPSMWTWHDDLAVRKNGGPISTCCRHPGEVYISLHTYLDNWTSDVPSSERLDC